MPLDINLPTDVTAGDSGHVAGHEATNTAVNATAAAVDALAPTGFAGRACRFYADNTAQTFANFQLADVDLNTEHFNDDSELFVFDAPTNTITVAAAGLYLAVTEVKYDNPTAPGATGQRYASLAVNGDLQREAGTTSGTGGTVSVMGMLRLNVDDAISVGFYTDNALPLVTNVRHATGISLAMLGT